MLHKVLAKIQEIIGIAKFDNTKILTETDNELPDDITIKNVVIIIICIIKDDGKFYVLSVKNKFGGDIGTLLNKF